MVSSHRWSLHNETQEVVVIVCKYRALLVAMIFVLPENRLQWTKKRTRTRTRMKKMFVVVGVVGIVGGIVGVVVFPTTSVIYHQDH